MLQFADIISQERAIQLLRQAMAEKRLPHALIFAGPTGVGKRTTADALAAILLCPNAFDMDSQKSRAVLSPSPPQPCGTCESCRLMAAGNHPDFHLVYRQLIRVEKQDSKARELAADVVRDYLIKPANHRASMNHGKVFVVEEAELMNAAAQNTLLKTLEEPAPETFIILLTDQAGALLPTIRSRCQMIPFGVVEPKQLMAELKKRDVKNADDAAFFAEGSLGNAVRWAEQGVIEKAMELRQQIEQMAAGQTNSGMVEWLRKASDEYATKQLELDKLASKDQAMHDGLAIYLRLTSLILRQMFRQTADTDRQERLCQVIENIAETEINLQANVTVSLALMNWSMGMERELVGK